MKFDKFCVKKGFIDVPIIGGGLKTNFRYLIASANAKDLSALNPESSKLGHVLYFIS